MKRQILTLLLIGVTITVTAQIPEKAFELTNSLSNLWYKSDPTEAVEASKELNEIYQPFFISRVHNDLALEIKSDNHQGKAQSFLKALYKCNDPSIKEVVEALYLWDQSFALTKGEEVNEILRKFYGLLGEQINFKSKTEKYGLRLIKDLGKRNLGDVSLKGKILDKIIANLEGFQYIDNPALQRGFNKQRAWCRYLLSYSYNYLFETQKKEEYLKKAAKYSPDNTDTQNKHSYYYDVKFFDGHFHNVGYKKKYFSYLNEHDKKDQALSVLMEEAFVIPLDNNMKKVKDYYAQIGYGELFEAFWYRFINSKMEEVPPIKVTFESGVLDLSKKRKDWVYIDVWGSWCGPCCRELPEFNTVAKMYNGNPLYGIRFYSFAYRTPNLKEFMEKHGYTFPVSEIGENVKQQFNISSYPTKLLISPDNKYLKIPFNVNWHEYIRNYCQIKDLKGVSNAFLKRQ